MRFSSLCAALVLSTAAHAAASAQPQGGPQPASVVIDPARTETVDHWREVTGQLQAVRRSVVASREAGLILELDLDSGDLIRRGDVIARLDATIAEIEVRRAESLLNTRRSQIAERQSLLEKAERDRKRIEESFRRDSASQSEVDDATTAVETARARLEQAQAEMATAEAELARETQRVDDMVILAPFTGRVVSKRAEVGQWVGVGDPLIELMEIERVEAWLDVPESVVGRLWDHEGTIPVQIRVTATGEVIEAEASGLIPQADPLSRLFPVRVRLVNEDERLRPGMSVVGLVPTGTARRMLTVAKDAVMRDDAGAFVYFEQGGEARVARVEILFGAGDRVAVRSERLAEGAPVVVEGNERLFPGQPLEIIGQRTDDDRAAARTHAGPATNGSP